MTYMCYSGVGVVSFFFKMTGKTNPFFDWQKLAVGTGIIDLSLLSARDAALHNPILGYIGSDTMPTC
jgi:hypothetical protein